MAQERRHLRIPHAVIGAERVHQHQQRLVRASLPAGSRCGSPANRRTAATSPPSISRRRNASALPRYSSGHPQARQIRAGSRCGGRVSSTARCAASAPHLWRQQHHRPFREDGPVSRVDVAAHARRRPPSVPPPPPPSTPAQPPPLARCPPPRATPPASRRRRARVPAPCRPRNSPSSPGVRLAAAMASMQAVGIALVRHGGRSAAAFATRFGSLAHFALHQQRDVERHLSQACRVDAKCSHQRGEPVAMAVPGRVRTRQAELRRQRLADRDAAVAERGQGSAGAAELQVQRFVEAAGDARPAAPQPPPAIRPPSVRR